MKWFVMWSFLLGVICVDCITWKEFAEEWHFSTTEPYKPTKFMIDFVDKDDSIRARNNAFYKMSEAQLKSREETLGIGRFTPGFLLEEDFPIKKEYLDSITQVGGTITLTLDMLNTVAVLISDETQFEIIASFPFVKNIKPTSVPKQQQNHPTHDEL